MPNWRLKKLLLEPGVWWEGVSRYGQYDSSTQSALAQYITPGRVMRLNRRKNWKCLALGPQFSRSAGVVSVGPALVYCLELEH